MKTLRRDTETFPVGVIGFLPLYSDGLGLCYDPGTTEISNWNPHHWFTQTLGDVSKRGDALQGEECWENPPHPTPQERKSTTLNRENVNHPDIKVPDKEKGILSNDPLVPASMT